MELETLDLRDIFSIIWKRMFMIVSIVVVSTITVGVISYFVLEKEYQATTTLIVGKSNEATQDYQLQYNDVMLYQKLVKTYQEIAKSRTIAQEVIGSLGLSYSTAELQEKITVSAVGDTQVISIQIVDHNPSLAAQIANKLVEVFKEQIVEIMKVESVNVIDEAVVPNLPIRPRPVMNVAMAFAASLMVGLGIAFLLDYMDRTIKTAQDVETYLELPVIGEIPDMSQLSER
jgi:capsular polysaccharide biosynthesis protein